MSQSLLKLLKTQDPGRVIDVVAPEYTVAMAEMLPEVDRVFVLPVAHGELKLSTRRRLGRRLRERGYDRAFVLPNSFKSALVAWWAKIPRRTGWLGETRLGVLNDARRLDKERYRLMIERFMALALEEHEELPGLEPFYPSVHVSGPDARRALRHLPATSAREAAEGDILVLCPGAEYGPAKRWPVEHYAAVARVKLAAGWQVWILGGPGEAAVGEQIRAAAGEGVLNLAGKTSIPEAVSLLSLASQVVSNDSGLMHVAAALQRPVVVLYGSTSPDYTPPLGTAVTTLSLDLACSPCFERECPLGHFRCMRDLRPERVLDALAALPRAGRSELGGGSAPSDPGSTSARSAREI